MNLATDPWIPIMSKGGGFRFVSLLDVFDETSDIADLSCRFHERVSMMRLFTAIACRAQMPGDPGRHKQYRDSFPAEAIRYLQDGKNYFELFVEDVSPGRVPFMQMQVGSKSLSTDAMSLDFSRASGNNGAFFDHGDNSAGIPPERQAINLLVQQCFRLGGGVNGKDWTKHENRETNATDAPCSIRSSMHFFLRGESLLDSIWLNIPSRPRLANHFEASFGNDWVGVPSWEMPVTSLDDGGAIHNTSRTFLGRLVPYVAAVALEREGKRIMLDQAIRFPTATNSIGIPVEISCCGVKNSDPKRLEKESLLTPMGIVLEKNLIRNLPAALTERVGDQGYSSPLTLSNFIRFGGTILGGGLVRDQADKIACVESAWVLPPKVADDAADEFRSQMEDLDRAWTAVRRGLYKFASMRYVKRSSAHKSKDAVAKPPEPKDVIAKSLECGAEHLFWSTLSNMANELGILCCEMSENSEKAQEMKSTWDRKVFFLARDVLRKSTDDDTADGRKAAILAEKAFYWWLDPNNVAKAFEKKTVKAKSKDDADTEPLEQE